MKVCMVGWDFPPHISGGLGVAVHDLAHAVQESGVDVTVMLPQTQDITGSVPVVFADTINTKIAEEINQVKTQHVSCYGSSTNALDHVSREQLWHVLHHPLFAQATVEYIKQNSFDVIHVHDLLTYSVGIIAKMETGLPMTCHVHATSFDQAAGDNVDPAKFDLEKQTFALADHIIVVSNKVKKTLVEKHGVNPEKIEVVYNGICPDVLRPAFVTPPFLTKARENKQNIVLYVGRITIQKGVDYFVQSALQVLVYRPNTIFVIVGDGDLMGQVLSQVSHSGHSKQFVFTGWLSQTKVKALYHAADLFVMPSVSEPFGLVPLEALQYDTPVIISKQSGVAEVLTHALQVDFWDVGYMTEQMISVLRHDAMAHELRTNGLAQANTMSWGNAAQRCKNIYHTLKK